MFTGKNSSPANLDDLTGVLFLHCWIDSQGTVIYEAFTETNNSSNRYHRARLKNKPLTTIIQDLEQILPNKQIVCHNAKHDAKVLYNTFRKCRKPFLEAEFVCTVELAKNIYPSLPTYSLNYLAKKLLLKVDNQIFRQVCAHRSKYDAQFTWQLYIHLLSMSINTTSPTTAPSNIINPFSSNRVDNPFQSHLDFNHVYQEQFDYLCSILDQMKADPNKQSRGAVIMGEPGSGKTHLMMRLAKAKLKTNRLLYIRHPNNAKAVNDHIYARILESFSEKVDINNTQRTQLDLLLARSFTHILKKSRASQAKPNERLNKLIERLENDSLSLYDRLGKQGSDTYRNNWNFIEKRITQWWEQKYSTGGYAHIILKGIIKFCTYITYRDQIRRWLAGGELDDNLAEQIDLINWQSYMNSEELALDAMSLFGRLSTLDEPLIIVFDQLESLINNSDVLTSFGYSITEILTHVPNSLIIINLFPDRWQKFQEDFTDAATDRLSQHQLTLERPSNQDLQKILQLKCEAAKTTLEEIFEANDLDYILQGTCVRQVINRASNYFRYKYQNIALPSETEQKQPGYNISVEQRIQDLENGIKQIADVCQSIINKKSVDSSQIYTGSEVRDGSDIKDTIPGGTNSKPPEDTKKEKIKKYLKDTEEALTSEYNNFTIIKDEDDLGTLVEIVKAFKVYDSSIKTNHLTLGKRVLPEHLLIANGNHKNVIGFLSTGSQGFTPRIKNFNELTTLHKNIKFTLLRDPREPQIKSQGGSTAIEKLNYTPNGEFVMMDKVMRVHFELISKMIVDIYEGDLEAEIPEAIEVFKSKYSHCWLIRKIFST